MPILVFLILIVERGTRSPIIFNPMSLARHYVDNKVIVRCTIYGENIIGNGNKFFFVDTHRISYGKFKPLDRSCSLANNFSMRINYFHTNPDIMKKE